jgi:hypothetical protein
VLYRPALASPVPAARPLRRATRLWLQTHPGLTAQQAAAGLGVTDAALLAAHCGVFSPRESPLKARRLMPHWAALARHLQRSPGWWQQAGPADGSLQWRARWPEGATLPAVAEAYALEHPLPAGQVHRSIVLCHTSGQACLQLLPDPHAHPGTVLDFYDAVQAFGSPRLDATVPEVGPDAASAAPALPMAHPPAGDVALTLPADSLYDLLAQASQWGLPLQLGVPGALPWAGRVQQVGDGRGPCVAQGPGLHLAWHEARLAQAQAQAQVLLHHGPGQPLWHQWRLRGAAQQPLLCISALVSAPGHAEDPRWGLLLRALASDAPLPCPWARPPSPHTALAA